MLKKQTLIILLLLACFNKASAQPDLNNIFLPKPKKNFSNVTVIALGEMGHGYETINMAKSSFIKTDKNADISAVIFESTFTGSIIAFLNKDLLTERLKHFLYPFWNTPPVQQALRSFYEQEQNKQHPKIIGFDIQEDCRFVQLSAYLKKDKVITRHTNELDKCDSILSYYIGKNFSRKTALRPDEYEQLISNYDLVKKEITEQALDEQKNKLLLRSLENRKWLCKYLTIKSVGDRMYYRDSLMAMNVLWLKNEFFPDEKIILWAADIHISKFRVNDKPKWMGEWLSSVLKEKYYAISYQEGKLGASRRLGPDKPIKFLPEGEKFDVIIYRDKLKKISPDHWKTPCD